MKAASYTCAATIGTTEGGPLKAIEAFISVRSVDTGVSERDTHLR